MTLKITLKIVSNAENRENTKEWVTLKFFKYDLKFSSVIAVYLNKYFSVTIDVVSFVDFFQCDFSDFSVWDKISVWFSVS